MSGTPNLGYSHIVSGQSAKEITANAAFDGLDAAHNSVLAIGTADADITLTSSQFRSGVHFRFTDAMTGAHQVVVPSLNINGALMQRLFIVTNETTGGFKLTVGTDVSSPPGLTVDVLATDGSVLLYSDGNDIVQVGSTSGGGGGGATNFTDLADVPTSYSGQGGKVVTVKMTEDGLELDAVAGAGGIPAGSNISSFYGTPLTIGGGYAGYTFLLTILGRTIVNAASTFKIAIYPSGANTKIANSVIYQCTKDTRTVVSVTTITWNSGASFPTVLATSGEVYSDAITFTFDPLYDYVIAVYTDPTTSNASFLGWYAAGGSGTQTLPGSFDPGVYASDQTGVAVAGTVPLGSGGALGRSAITALVSA